ncbi:MAG TPA: hypothetical protein VFT61_04765 [Sphingomicrobium sp.]|nr:hypothetical protein [Sphingomicrobium sp.]
MTLLLKDPDSVLDYAIDWGTDYLIDDVLAGSSWVVDPDEADGVQVQASAFDSTTATVTASGGVAGHIYQLTNHVELASGLTDSRSVTLRVERR